MRYIGSKYNLLSTIEAIVLNNCEKQGIFCDLFAGTHSVAAHFKKLGFKIISNDLLYLAYVFGRALIQNNIQPTFAQLKDIPIVNPTNLFEGVGQYSKALDYLNQIEEVSDGFIFNAYCPGGDNKQKRQYLSDKNGKKVDAVRQQIETWRNDEFIDEDEYYILLLSLLEAVSKVTNISGTYGAYLKVWDERTYKDLKLEPFTPIPSNVDHEVYQKDSNLLIKEIECDVLYIDPPYNSRQYITNYHFLETIARYDNPDIYGKTGLRSYSELEKSAYCSKFECLKAFNELISDAKAKHIVVSYNSEGIMNKYEILDILSQKGRKPNLNIIDYRRFKSNSNGTVKDKVQEYLFYV